MNQQLLSIYSYIMLLAITTNDSRCMESGKLKVEFVSTKSQENSEKPSKTENI